MRISRLDLIRYGHFYDHKIELPIGEKDFHIVFGPNEAGKTTTRCALEDFLFGIDARTPYGFAHGYKTMRLGADLDTDAGTFRARRKKGNKNTILDPEDVASPELEKRLQSLLGGVDRASYQRMFSMDRIKLEEGGREILSEEGDVGQVIFSAGVGIGGIRKRLEQLKDEAESLWTARKAQHRQFYIVQDKFKKAEQELRDHTCRAKAWKDAKKNLESAERDLSQIQDKLEQLGAEQRRLSRIRRLHQHVAVKADADAGILELGATVRLPENASQQLAELLRLRSEIGTRTGTLTGQLVTARRTLEELAVDESILGAAEEIQGLGERRVTANKARLDLPKRRAELEGLDQKIQSLALELGWGDVAPNSIEKRIPTKLRMKAVRSMLAEHSNLESILESRREAHAEARERLNDSQQRAQLHGEDLDTSKLRTIVTSLRRRGDLDHALQDARDKFGSTQKRIERLFAGLHPQASNEKELFSVVSPSSESIQDHRDRAHILDNELREQKKALTSAERELVKLESGFSKIETYENALSLDKLEEARKRRDDLWTIAKLKFIDSGEVSTELQEKYGSEVDDLPSAFEESMGAADRFADQRFDTAEATARLAEISAQIEEKASEISGLKSDLERNSDERSKLESKWNTLWEAAPFSPLAPEKMLEWFDTRNQIAAAADSRLDLDASVLTRKRDIQIARDSLLTEMAKLHEDRSRFEDESLSIVLERADEIVRDGERSEHERGTAEQDVERAKVELQKQSDAMSSAERACTEWQAKWTQELRDIGAQTDLTLDVVATWLDILDELRECAIDRNKLISERIEKIESDLAAFDSRSREVAGRLAPDAVDAEPEEIVAKLERQLKEMERIRDRREDVSASMQNLEADIANLEVELREAEESLTYLHELADSGTIEELSTAVNRSDELRKLESEREGCIKLLLTQGDGLSVSELEAECASVDIDQAAIRDSALSSELSNLGGELTPASEKRAEAKRTFEAIGGEDAAAQAAATRQEAIAEFEDVAGRYVRARTASILLQGAIDHYRRDKQAPLLQRAGELFSMLTNGKYSKLGVDYDESDSPQLIGVKPDGGIVPVTGMSTGTSDQLYLAIRIAAVEDQLDTSESMPFIADDLFVNFDDERAAAGLLALQKLSEKTQVVFFTHHRHLVELARSTLGESVSTITLA